MQRAKKYYIAPYNVFHFLDECRNSDCKHHVLVHLKQEIFKENYYMGTLTLIWFLNHLYPS